jgi:HTH-type transcriptional regulator/antitoxin HigA
MEEEKKICQKFAICVLCGNKLIVEALPYKVIKSVKQYNEYCNILEGLVIVKKKSQAHQDAIDLLTLLIETWDEEHNTFSDADPIELLGYLMKENKMKAVNLAAELEISKSLLSDILHYRRGLSREVIRKLATRFKVSQELFNKPYKLVSPVNSHLKDASVMNTRKKLSKAI